MHYVALISFFVGKKGSAPEGGLGRHEEKLLGSFPTSSIVFITIVIIYFVAPLGC